MDGRTLAERLLERPLPLDETLAIARQIAEALETAHDCGIIHRDETRQRQGEEDGTVKVLDFGLAKAFDPATAVSIDSLSSPTISVPGRSPTWCSAPRRAWP